MAAVHTGAIPQSCGKCQRDPSLKDHWGCNKPLQMAVERLLDDRENQYHYYSCPNLFISLRCKDFYNKYTALKSGFAAPMMYGEEESWFLDAVNYYENWVNFYTELRKKS